MRYAHQAEKLSLHSSESISEKSKGGVAVEAKFVTPLDPVIQTADGNRLPTVPVDEAHKINTLKNLKDGKKPRTDILRPRGLSRFYRRGAGADSPEKSQNAPLTDQHDGEGARLGAAIPPSRTHPLFPPLPLYGPPSRLRKVQCRFFRLSSFLLSTGFLLVIVLGAIFTSIPPVARWIWLRITLRDPDQGRPFLEEERRRQALREKEEQDWLHQKNKRRRRNSQHKPDTASMSTDEEGSFEPLEGGPDKLVCDARYYARRVGLDVEVFKVQTEDGFIISLWHVYNPKEYTPVPQSERKEGSPEVFVRDANGLQKSVRRQYHDGRRRYPVLMMHGLLQSAGAYCTNDDDSLAFYLCKQGYDVWLGNNRCGFEPEHVLLEYHDPRMWAWNLRQMGVMDLPAFVSRVLEETGFEKLGLVCHSQGTTQTFVALAKEQRPDLGDKISVFCALAPAAYAGPLIGKMYFKFMRIISPAMFRMFFGIHAFIPLMMTMHGILPGSLYGAIGYKVFSFLFNWTDVRWDRGIRDRLFQFSPSYVSAESMRWWLGRECFAKQRCVLATREEGQIEDVEDEQAELKREAEEEKREQAEAQKSDRGKNAWYNEKVPPMALWVAGRDDLVDGRRLLRRFERGREPHVNLVYSKVIEEYEHLDVIWAMDAIEQVGKEVKQVIWQTMSEDARKSCRMPLGVEEIKRAADDEEMDGTPA